MMRRPSRGLGWWCIWVGGWVGGWVVHLGGWVGAHCRRASKTDAAAVGSISASTCLTMDRNIRVDIPP